MTASTSVWNVGLSARFPSKDGGATTGTLKSAV